METIENIKTRRSRRKYLKKNIDNEILKKIIDVVKYSPSSVNCQPWEIIVVKNQEIKSKIAELKNKFTPEHLRKKGFTSDFIAEAPVLIFVCVDIKKSPFRFIEDGAIAAANILLAANDFNLGSVYICGFSTEQEEIEKTIKQTLRLPKNIRLVAMLPMGYADPNEHLEKRDLKEINEIVHYENW